MIVFGHLQRELCWFIYLLKWVTLMGERLGTCHTAAYHLLTLKQPQDGWEKAYQAEVQFADIDQNRHVNNCVPIRTWNALFRPSWESGLTEWT